MNCSGTVPTVWIIEVPLYQVYATISTNISENYIECSTKKGIFGLKSIIMSFNIKNQAQLDISEL